MGPPGAGQACPDHLLQAPCRRPMGFDGWLTLGNTVLRCGEGHRKRHATGTDPLFQCRNLASSLLWPSAVLGKWSHWHQSLAA